MEGQILRDSHESHFAKDSIEGAGVDVSSACLKQAPVEAIDASSDPGGGGATESRVAFNETEVAV